MDVHLFRDGRFAGNGDPLVCVGRREALLGTGALEAHGPHVMPTDA